MRKICLTGASLNTSNMGVSALAISSIKIIKHIDKEIEITLLDGTREPGYREIDLGDSSYNLKIVNFRKSPKSRLEENIFWILFLSFLYRFLPSPFIRKITIEKNPFLKEMRDSLFIGSIHGGDSFSDIYGFIKFIWGVIPDLITILLKKPLILFPQTYGPYNNYFTKKIAHYIIKKSNIALCRDINGPSSLDKLFLDIKTSTRVLYCPDVAFFLHVTGEDKIKSKIDGLKKNKQTLIGINVNGLMYKGGYDRRNMFGLKIDYGQLILDIIKKILSENDSNIVMIPHNTAPIGNIESDLESCEEIVQKVQENLKDRITVLGILNSPSEVKYAISKCDFFIGSRMHACIAALSSGIPAIGIAYSKKFLGVFESVGIEELVVDARMLDTESALNMIWQKFENRNYWHNFLKKKKTSIYNLIINTFSELFKRA